MMIFAIGKRKNSRLAFTLIELIVVMTMMVVVMAVVSPSLQGFFHGRNLDNEARQFMALTRYGHSRAISEGLPVELWINPQRNTYGLQAVGGYTESATDSKSYELNSSMRITVSPPTSLLVRSNYWTPAAGQSAGLMKIRFQPDGYISDNSPANIYFRQDTGREIWIAEAATHLSYEMQTGPAPGHR